MTPFISSSSPWPGVFVSQIPFKTDKFWYFKERSGRTAKEKLKNLENWIFSHLFCSQYKCFVHLKIGFVLLLLLFDSSAHLRVVRCEQNIKKKLPSWYFYFSKGRTTVWGLTLDRSTPDLTSFLLQSDVNCFLCTGSLSLFSSNWEQYRVNFSMRNFIPVREMTGSNRQDRHVGGSPYICVSSQEKLLPADFTHLLLTSLHPLCSCFFKPIA